MTFRFEALVDQVSGSANELVQVETGDIIHGSFTYEPTPSGARSDQMNRLRFDINGLSFVTNAFQISLENDAALPSTMPIFPGIIDAAHIVCSFSENNCTPEFILGQNGWKWKPLITFSGNFGILANEELTSDMNWNGFGNRNFQLRLENQSSSSGLTIQSTIGPLTLVPEPSSFILGMIVSGLVCLSLTHRRIERYGPRRNKCPTC